MVAIGGEEGWEAERQGLEACHLGKQGRRLGDREGRLEWGRVLRKQRRV
jgi:hypothetical protein